MLPADLRPPWFLPCTYSDGYVCLQAQYYGAIPTGYTLVMGGRQGAEQFRIRFESRTVVREAQSMDQRVDLGSLMGLQAILVMILKQIPS